MQAEALVRLGVYLKGANYAFTTPTPKTHQTVIARPYDADHASLTDIFGWNREFLISSLDSVVIARLRDADAIAAVPGRDGYAKCRYRFSSLGEGLYLHSAFPTEHEGSVFFGPDTYRFVRFALAELGETGPRAIDLGCGSGAGGLAVAIDQLRRRPHAKSIATLELTDINSDALIVSEINTNINRRLDAQPFPRVKIYASNLLESAQGNFDLILANPPFLADPKGRAYRDGGGRLGTGLTERILRESPARLNAGGKLILYTASPIQNGADPVRAAAQTLDPSQFEVAYHEIDPDIFGEELETPAYRAVDRIAAVGVVVTRRGGTSRAPVGQDV